MRTLVVDDSSDIAEPICRLLEIAGTSVRRADNGATGLHIAGEWQPDLIFLDIMMPGIDGLGVLRQLREAGSKAYIAMMTAICEPQMIDFAKSIGASDYLIKGKIDLNSLKDVLRKSVPEGDSLAMKLLEEQQELIACLPSQ